MKLFAVPITIYATAYVRAETAALAHRRARDTLTDTMLEIKSARDMSSIEPTAFVRDYLSDDFGGCDISPAMTIGDPDDKLIEEVSEPESV